MQNRFLSIFRTGQYDAGSLFASSAVTWGGFFLLSSVPMLGLMAFYISRGHLSWQDFMENPNNLGIYGIPPLILFLGVMGQFPIGFIGLWLSNNFILKRKFMSMVTSASRFRWNRFFLGLIAWMTLLGAYGIIIWLKAPDSIQYQPDWNSFFQFLPLALILVPIQCAFEEIAVRGQLLQNLHGFFDGKLLPVVSLIASSLFFAILHSLNPEVETYGYLTMMAQYFAIGLIFGIFAILEEGLEISIGLHIGNNLFSLLFVSYPGSVLDTPSIFSQTSVHPWQDFIALMGFGTLLYMIIYGRNAGKITRLFQKVPAPMPPELPGQP